jgi:hypothetical protein
MKTIIETVETIPFLVEKEKEFKKLLKNRKEGELIGIREGLEWNPYKKLINPEITVHKNCIDVAATYYFVDGDTWENTIIELERYIIRRMNQFVFPIKESDIQNEFDVLETSLKMLREKLCG